MASGGDNWLSLGGGGSSSFSPHAGMAMEVPLAATAVSCSDLFFSTLPAEADGRTCGDFSGANLVGRQEEPPVSLTLSLGSMSYPSTGGSSSGGHGQHQMAQEEQTNFTDVSNIHGYVGVLEFQ